jgi:cbb3-type cytochrome oxidase subunit 3
MILVKKVFIFSKTMIICLLCPLLCGLFFFWKGAKGELSYKARKNPALQDSPPAAGRFCDILPFRRSAILPGGLFIA